jgi:pimeloyl-ACP methyl ester carboxylesterase
MEGAGAMSETSGTLERPGGERLAWRRVTGKGPTVVWLGGFRSDMMGTKAEVLAHWADETGHDYLRFDYFGHGQSSGDFLQGSVTRWREDVLAVIDELTQGPLILVGSSMGGWLALLAAVARTQRVQALVLVAPAPDFTQALIEPALSPPARAALEADGVWMEPSEHDPAGYPITRLLIEDGARWSVLPGPLGFKGPVRILQGGKDDAVPWRHAQELVGALESQDVQFTLIKDGDHRLSRPRDLLRLVTAVEELTAED